MNKNHILIFSILVFINGVFAQSSILRFSPGAKSITLGRSGVVEIYDPTALYWNPALLGYLKQQQTVVSINEPYHLTYTGYSQFYPMLGTVSASIAHTQKDISGTELYSLGWGKQISKFVYTGIGINNAITETENWVSFGAGFYIRADNNPNSIYKRFPPLSFLESPAFRDRLTLGMSVQHVPLTEQQHSHQTRVGASYRLTPDGFTIVFAYHMQSVENTSHLSFILPIQRNIKFIAGIMDYKFNQTALGAEINMKSFDLQLAYDYDSKRIVFSTAIPVGTSYIKRSEEEHELAKKAIENQLPHEALYYTKRALDLDPDNSKAEKYFQTLSPLIIQNTIKAKKTLKTAMELEKNEWYISAAMHYMQVLKLEPDNIQAQAALERIRPKVNVHTERRFQLGVATFEKNELLKAKEIFESILLVRPDHQKSEQYLADTNARLYKQAENHFFAGLGYYSQKKYDLAENEFKSALVFYPAYNDASEYIERIERDRANNIKRIDELLQESQNLEARKLWLQAIERYKQILEIDNSNQVALDKISFINQKVDQIINQYIRNGKNQFNQGNYSSAKTIFNKILKLDSNNTTARQYLNSIDDKTSGKTIAFIDRAQIHIDSENYTLALAVLDSALVENPDFSTAVNMRKDVINHMDTRQMLSNALREYQNQNYLESMEICNQILIKDPENIQALRYLEQCQRKLNEQVDDYFNKGLEMYTKENYRTAILMWDKALEINPYHRGSLEYRKRAIDRLKAIEQLQ